MFNCNAADLTKKQGTGLNCGTNIATVIPEQWTCFESPLMDLEIPKDWKLIDDYDRYQEIISLNAAPRLGGFQNNPPKDNCIHMFKNFKEFANSNAGKNYGDLSLFDCLHDLRARLYEGDREYVREIFEHWARVGLDQPKDGGIGGEDYQYFNSLNYVSGIYAQEKDNIEFSDTFKAWLTNRLLNVEFRSFRVPTSSDPVSYRSKEVLYNYKEPVWGIDFSTPRFMITEAWLVGGLALNNKDIFDEGIDSLQYITSLFNEENIHPWASRGIRMPGYYNQIPNWLSNYAVILDTVDYDFMEHEMPNGSKVHEAIKLAFDIVWSDDLSLFWPYIQLNIGTAGDETFPELLKPLSERPKGADGASGIPSKPQRVVRQALRYVDKYQPELKDRYGYEEVYSKNVTGTEDMNDVYNDSSWYSMYNLASAFDTHSIYKASDKVFFSEENIAVEVEACKTTPLNGEYEARWIRDHWRDNGEWEFVGSEPLILDQCEGEFEGIKQFDPRPTPAVRKKLIVKYQLNGEISIKGDLNLYDVDDLRYTELYGNINDGEISGVWGLGNRIKIELVKK